MKRRRKPAAPPAPGSVEQLQVELALVREQLAVEQATREAESVALIEAQQELELSTARYADLYDFAPVGYVTLSRNGVIRDINLRGASLLGSERAYLLGRPLLPQIAEVDRRNFQNYLLRLQRQPGEQTVELDFAPRNDLPHRVLQLTGIISADPSLTEVHFRTILTDVTERRHTELSLMQLNETMLAMLEAIPDIFFVVGPDGRIKFRNQTAFRFMDATGLNDLSPEIRAELTEVLQTRRHLLPTDLKRLHRFIINHEERFFLSRVVCLLGPDARTALGAVAMLQDVTEMRLLDEVKTGLISTVSHELKTPITSVRTALMMLLEKTFGPLTPKQTELVSVARDEGERLLHTLDALLDLARFESSAVEMRTESVKPKELVRAAVTAVWSAVANSRTKVHTDVASELPALAVDRERILHVLTNLLTNAIKYSPAGGDITVRAYREERGVRFSVVDQGPGVPEEYQLRIFEKFFRVPGLPAQGAGLGLSIAREFVRAHNGQIGVQSQPGQGSEFYFILPLKRN